MLQGIRGLLRISDWRVRTKVSLLLLVAALVPTTIIATNADGAIRGSLTRGAGRVLQSEAAQLATDMDGWLERTLALVAYTAQSGDIVAYASGGPESRALVAEEAQETLRRLVAQDSSFESAAVLDLTGTIVLSAIPSEHGQNFQFRPYFTDAREGKTHISELSIALLTNQPSLFFAAPVKDRSGKVVSVLRLRTNGKALQALLNRLNDAIAPGSVAYVIDPDGIVVLHGTDNPNWQFHSLKPLPAEREKFLLETRRFGNRVEEFKALPADPPLIAAFEGTGTTAGFSHKPQGGTDVYYGALASLERQPWKVVVDVPAAAFLADAERLSQFNQITAVFVVGAALLAALLFARLLTRPLGALQHVLARVRAGEEVQPPVEAGDELGRLSAQLIRALLEIRAQRDQSERERESMQRQIVNLLNDVSTLADGDLTVQAQVTSGALGSVADAVNFMAGELRKIIANVNETTLQVSSSTSEILATSDLLARHSEDQARRIGTAASAVDELARSIHQVSEHAARSTQVAEDARATARRGAESAQATSEAMARIRAHVQQTSKKIKRLGESSQEIGQIVRLIEEIAEQTNMLALNAAIQAAMAGEHGRGFAVVAEEVRRLAERAGQATRQIATLVGSIQTETAEAVVAMEESTREVVESSSLVDEASRALAEIDAVVGRVAELMMAITEEAGRQAQASADVARVMNDISSVTKTTADGTRQAAASVNHLAQLAERLRESVATFKLAHGGAQA